MQIFLVQILPQPKSWLNRATGCEDMTLFTVFAIIFPSYSLENTRVRLTIIHVLVNFAKIPANSSLRRDFIEIMPIFKRIKSAREQMPRLTNCKYNHVWAVTEHAM